MKLIPHRCFISANQKILNFLEMEEISGKGFIVISELRDKIIAFDDAEQKRITQQFEQQAYERGKLK